MSDGIQTLFRALHVWATLVQHILLDSERNVMAKILKFLFNSKITFDISNLYSNTVMVFLYSLSNCGDFIRKQTLLGEIYLGSANEWENQ